MEQYVLDVAGLSDRGVKRDHNEDAWASPPEGATAAQIAAKGRLYVVADGVGGHLAGDVASKIAVHVIQQHYYQDPSTDIVASLTAAIQAASQQIDEESAARLERRGMSTTVTAAVLHENRVIVANVGDSRTYLVRDDQTQQLTSDHTWVEEQVRVGLITREEAARHPQRNIITRSLGGNQKLEVDIFEEQVGPGDSILLCSDGLSNMVDSEEIGTLVSKGWKAETVVRELIELAKQRGAPDNVTAVLLNVVRRKRGGLGRLLFASFLGGLALVATGLVYVLVIADGGERNPVSQDRDQLLASSPSPSPSSVPSPFPALSSPLDAPLVAPELIWPAENAKLVIGEPITFLWEWNNQLPDGQFVFVLQASDATRPLVHDEFPLDQRQFVLARELTPGRYLWTLTVSGTGAEGISAGRFLTLLEPTPVPR